MKIVLHDFSGHPFQIQLSRELVRRGHTVHHLYSLNIVGAKGNLVKTADDPDLLQIEGISIGHDINRYNFIKRLRDESLYGRALSRRVAEIKPDLLIASNTPLDSLFTLYSTCKRYDIQFVFWLQDILGIAAKNVLSKKLGVIGSLIGSYYTFREARILRSSDHVVAISPDFKSTLSTWNIPDNKLSIIHNWAPLNEIPALARDNEWSTEHQLNTKKVALYSGALGLKHNPQLLLDLAIHMQKYEPDQQLIVISEGHGADWLLQQQQTLNLSSLTLLPFQPFELLPEILASADVVLGILEPEAGEFCVPSKVLSYMCVARPIVLAALKRNLASQLLINNNCGLVSDPKNSKEFVSIVTQLLHNPTKSHEMASNARAFAEYNFDIDNIGNAFEDIIHSLKGT